MAETIKIGGELESMATGKKVADASAIKDSSQNNRSQASFNEDTIKHENAIYNNTNGINKRLDDIEAAESITYEGGDAQIAQGSDFTNPDATKRAKIPTVGAILDGLNDGIYDVSKRNPTGGPNSDGKFTLEYILNNANTLIPAGWRHGGMTISFVDSSDNKYVQYRLMANQWSTTPANWQKQGAEVTVSQNTETGPAIADITIGNKNNKIRIPYLRDNVARSLYLNNAGAVGVIMISTGKWTAQGGGATTDKIPVYKGDLITVVGAMFSSGWIIAFTTDGVSSITQTTFTDGVAGQGWSDIHTYQYKVQQNGYVAISYHVGYTDTIAISSAESQALTESCDKSATKLSTFKKVSIIGDSISTYNQKGFKIDGYATAYPNSNWGVESVEQTWWKQVINNIGSIIEVNASYSGSCATTTTGTIDHRPNFVERVPLLGNPDVIFIALGTNDSLKGAEIGEIDYDALSYDLDKFAPAYVKGIKDTMEAYPNADIVCIVFDMGASYKNTIKTIANHYNLTYIDVRDLVDGDVHPDRAEMQAVGDKVTEVITRSIFEWTNNPEWVKSDTDGNGNILGGYKKDGKFYADIAGFDKQKQLLADITVKNELIKPVVSSIVNADMTKEEFVNVVNQTFYTTYANLCCCNPLCFTPINTNMSWEEIYQQINHNFREEVCIGVSKEVICNNINYQFTQKIFRFCDVKTNPTISTSEPNIDWSVRGKAISSDVTEFEEVIETRPDGTDIVNIPESEPTALISPDGEKVYLYAGGPSGCRWESEDGLLFKNRTLLTDDNGNIGPKFTDGITTIPYADINHRNIVYIDGIYYMIGVGHGRPGEGDGMLKNTLVLHMSTDGIQFFFKGVIFMPNKHVVANMFPESQEPDLVAHYYGNSNLVRNRGKWYMYFEIQDTVHNRSWEQCIATCDDILYDNGDGTIGNWDCSCGLDINPNPIFATGDGIGIGYGNVDIIRGMNNMPIKHNGRYYMYLHGSYPNRNQQLRTTAIFRAYSEDLIHWTNEGTCFDNRDLPTVHTITGNGDQSTIEFRNKVFMYYSHDINHTEQGIQPEIRIIVDDRPFNESLKLKP